MPTHQELLSTAYHYLGGSLGGLLTFPRDKSFVIDYGRGGKFYDMDGKEYLDFVLASGPLILGHAHPAIVQAVQERIVKGTTFYALNAEAIQLAETLVKAIGCAERVKFATTGTEATHFALRLARAYTGREKILKFEGAFHGHHDHSIMSYAPEAPFVDFPQAVPYCAGIPTYVQDTVLIGQYNDIETTGAIIEEHHQDLAAVILEPYQRVIPPKPGFLESLRRITREFGIVLIFDEIVTGFRYMYGGAQDYYGVIPDLATFGKIIGGGFPLSAICGPAEIIALADAGRPKEQNYVYVSGTMNGNPVSAAASLATLKVLRQDGVYPVLHAKGEKMRSGLRAILNSLGIPAQVYGVGPWFDIIFSDQPVENYRDYLASDTKKLADLRFELLKRGIFAWVLNFICTEHTDQDLDRALNIYEDSLRALHH